MIRHMIDEVLLEHEFVSISVLDTRRFVPRLKHKIETKNLSKNASGPCVGIHDEVLECYNQDESLVKSVPSHCYVLSRTAYLSDHSYPDGHNGNYHSIEYLCLCTHHFGSGATSLRRPYHPMVHISSCRPPSLVPSFQQAF